MVLERILLQTIKFDLQVEHPYQFLLKYAKQLKGNGVGSLTLLSVVLGMEPKTLSSAEPVLCFRSTAHGSTKPCHSALRSLHLTGLGLCFSKEGNRVLCLVAHPAMAHADSAALNAFPLCRTGSVILLPSDRRREMSQDFK